MNRTLASDANRMYELSQDDDGDCYLCVMAGGIGMYEVKMKLNTQELDRYGSEGKPFLDDLAHSVAKYHNTTYKDRTGPA
jgi:hypothetical protein